MGICHLLESPEFTSSYKGRVFGKYQAIVKDNKDPQELGRVKVICENIFGSDLSPWAKPCFPMSSGVDTGMVFVPNIDDLVWLEFEEGIVNSPIYVGGFPTSVRRGRVADASEIEETLENQVNSNMLPTHAQGLPDGTDFDGSSKGTPGVPGSSFAGIYPHVDMIKTKGGHLLEFDNTTGAERIQLLHVSGAHIEILPDGSINIISEGTLNKRSLGENNSCSGPSREKISGSKSLDIAGDFTINVGGKYKVNSSGVTPAGIGEPVTIEGDDIKDINGSWTRNVLNNISLQCGGSAAIGSMGDFNIQSGGVGSIIYSNSINVPNPLSETLNIIAQNGKCTIKATDPTSLLSQLGMEIQPLGTAPPFTPINNIASIGPHIFIGNLLTPPARSPLGVPFVQENVVLGQQLSLYLTGLQSFLSAFLADYLTHIHPQFSPPVTAVAQAPILAGQLSALVATFLTPGISGNPTLLSDIVFVSKQ